MGRTCTIQSHPDRDAIDAAIVAGIPLRDIAGRFRVSKSSLARYKSARLPAALVAANQGAGAAHALDVVAQLRAINDASRAILAEARRAGDPQTALKAVDRIQRQIELQAKLLGDLDERPQVNVVLSPEWLNLRLVIVQALADHPEAQRAVVGALSANGGMS